MVLSAFIGGQNGLDFRRLQDHNWPAMNADRKTS
jgi:hypothetical protein